MTRSRFSEPSVTLKILLTVEAKSFRSNNTDGRHVNWFTPWCVFSLIYVCNCVCDVSCFLARGTDGSDLVADGIFWSVCTLVEVRSHRAGAKCGECGCGNDRPRRRLSDLAIPSLNLSQLSLIHSTIGIIKHISLTWRNRRSNYKLLY